VQVSVGFSPPRPQRAPPSERQKMCAGQGVRGFFPSGSAVSSIGAIFGILVLGNLGNLVLGTVGNLRNRAGACCDAGQSVRAGQSVQGVSLVVLLWTIHGGCVTSWASGEAGAGLRGRESLIFGRIGAARGRRGDMRPCWVLGGVWMECLPEGDFFVTGDWKRRLPILGVASPGIWILSYLSYLSYALAVRVFSPTHPRLAVPKRDPHAPQPECCAGNSLLCSGWRVAAP
jgi:hypothetical protein